MLIRGQRGKTCATAHLIRVNQLALCTTTNRDVRSAYRCLKISKIHLLMLVSHLLDRHGIFPLFFFFRHRQINAMRMLIMGSDTCVNQPSARTLRSHLV